jgi:hypothetical protein
MSKMETGRIFHVKSTPNSNSNNNINSIAIIKFISKSDPEVVINVNCVSIPN